MLGLGKKEISEAEKFKLEDAVHFQKMAQDGKLDNLIIRDGVFPYDFLLENVTIKNFEWDEVWWIHARGKNITFSNGSIYKGCLRRARFENIVFNHVKLEKVDFAPKWNGEKSTFNSVIFENCELEHVNLEDGEIANITFVNCKMRYCRVGVSKAKIIFKDCDVENCHLDKLTEGSTIEADGGSVHIDSGCSHLKHILVKNVISGGIGVGECTIDLVDVSGKDITIGFPDATIKTLKVSAEKTKFIGTLSLTKINDLIIGPISKETPGVVSLFNAHVKHISLQDVKLDALDFENSTCSHVKLVNASVNAITAQSAVIDTLSLSNVDIKGPTNLENITINKLDVDRVSLSGESTAYGARVKEVNSARGYHAENVIGNALLNALIQ